MRHRIFYIAFALFAGLIAIKGWAAPAISSISGTMSHNQTVTISGSGFGTKAQAPPVLWDTFESGTNGNNINQSNATIGDWDTGAGSDKPKYSSVIKHAGNMASYHQFRPWTPAADYENASLSKNFSFSTLYMDFWMYVSYIDNKSRNFKPWRFYGDSDQMQTYFAWFPTQPIVINYHAPDLSDSEWTGPPVYTNGSWQHFQLQFLESSPNTANGRFIQWVNGGSPSNDHTFMTRINSAHLSEIRIGHFWATDALEGTPANSGANVYVDNVYIDITWSRVEIGDASTYTTSTHREIQIPTAWSSTSISIQVNTGTFTANQNAYLYIVDANGSLNSQGYPIVIGSSPSARPSSPTGLTIR